MRQKLRKISSIFNEELAAYKAKPSFGDFIVKASGLSDFSQEDSNSLKKATISSISKDNILQVLADIFSEPNFKSQELNEAKHFYEKLAQFAYNLEEKLLTSIYYLQTCCFKTQLVNFEELITVFNLIFTCSEYLANYDPPSIACIPDKATCLDYIIIFLNKFDHNLCQYLLSLSINSHDYLVNFLRFEPEYIKFISDFLSSCKKYASSKQLSIIYSKLFDSLHAKSSQFLRNFVESNAHLFKDALDIALQTSNTRILCYLSFIFSSIGRIDDSKQLINRVYEMEPIDEDDKILFVLFNRTLVNYGIGCALSGYFVESYKSLYNICLSGHFKELLGQDFSIARNTDRFARSERQCLLPPHLHIDLELLESLFLIVGFTLELSRFATKEFNLIDLNTRSKFSYKVLARIFDHSEKQFIPSKDSKLRENLKTLFENIINGCIENIYAVSDIIFESNILRSCTPKLAYTFKRYFNLYNIC